MRELKAVMAAVLFTLCLSGITHATYDPNDPNQTVLESWFITAETSDYLAWTAAQGLVEDSRDPGIPGAGLDETGMMHYHHPFANYMWMSQPRTGSQAGPWVKLTLPNAYEVESLLIWNHGQTYNQETLNRGMRWVTIEYSLNGNNWTTLGNVELHNAPGGIGDTSLYSYTDDVDFGGVYARYIRIQGFPVDQGGTFGSAYYGLAQATIVYTGIMPEPPFVPTQLALTRDQITVDSSWENDSNPLAGAAVCTINHAGIVDPGIFVHEANSYGGGMWISGGGGIGFPPAAEFPHEGIAWIKFNFDGVYNLGVMSLWNGKQYGLTARGLKKVYIDYTADGTTWQTLMDGTNDFFILDSGTSQNSGPDNHIDFGGIAAQSVVITADEFDGNYGDTQYYSLSEVRFGLAGTQWPGIPNYPSQNIITHDNITVSVPGDSDVVGEEFTLMDNSGLGSNFRHIADPFGMAMLQGDPAANSAAVPGKTAVGAMWFKFDFDTAYSLGKMRVWNHNQIGYAYPWDQTDRGLRNVTIQYTGDGNNWSTLGSFVIPRAVAEDQAVANAVIDFAGVSARSVVITAATSQGNWGDPEYYGLSQVEFGIQGTTFGYGIAELQAMASQWLDSGVEIIEEEEVCTGSPGWDLDGNCVVDLADFGIAGQRWLLNN